jgi:Domain of unknown function (DUF397)
VSSNGNTQATEISGPWMKSSYSGPQGNCVEVSYLADGQVAMRNSRHPSGLALVFTGAEWEAFLRGARDGEFGPPA